MWGSCVYIICGAAVCIMQGATWERQTDRDKNCVEAETCFSSLLLLSVVDEGAALKFCELAVWAEKLRPFCSKTQRFPSD